MTLAEKKCFKNTVIPSSFLLGKSVFGQYCSSCQVKVVFEETTTESAFKRRRVYTFQFSTYDSAFVKTHLSNINKKLRKCNLSKDSKIGDVECNVEIFSTAAVDSSSKCSTAGISRKCSIKCSRFYSRKSLKEQKQYPQIINYGSKMIIIG